MTKIFKVLSNIKHNGTDIKKGDFVEEFAGAQQLEQDGVLLEAEGDSIEEARERDAEYQADLAKQEAEKPEEIAPANTWEAKKDDTETVTDNAGKHDEDEDKGVVYDGPMEFYKVTGEVHPLNEDGTPKDETLEIGSIHELPKGAVDTDGGLWAVATEEEVQAEAEKLAPEEKTSFLGRFFGGKKAPTVEKGADINGDNL